MKLSYQDLFNEDKEAGRVQVEAEITTQHPASSYGQPVIVLDDGGALDLMSWTCMDYQVEESTEEEAGLLRQMGLI